MRVTRKNETGRKYGGGKLDLEQWEDLRRLVNAPRKTLAIIAPGLAEFLITRSKAESLIQAGVAEYSAQGQTIRPSTKGLSMISSFGLYT